MRKGVCAMMSHRLGNSNSRPGEELSDILALAFIFSEYLSGHLMRSLIQIIHYLYYLQYLNAARIHDLKFPPGLIHQYRAFSLVWLPPPPLTEGRNGADYLNIETYPRWNNREKSCISSSGLKLHHSWRLTLPATDPLLSVSQPWAAGGEVTCFFFTTVKSWYQLKLGLGRSSDSAVLLLKAYQSSNSAQCWGW